MQIEQHLEDGMILKRLKRHHLALRLSRAIVFVALCLMAWLIFLLLVEYYTPFSGAQWRYARFFFVLAVAMIILGSVGRALAGRRVDKLLPSLIAG